MSKKDITPEEYLPFANPSSAPTCPVGGEDALRAARKLAPWLTWSMSQGGFRGEYAYGSPHEIVIYLHDATLTRSWKAFVMSAQLESSYHVDAPTWLEALTSALLLWPHDSFAHGAWPPEVKAREPDLSFNFGANIKRGRP